MDGNRIQALIYRGYGVSAAKVGLPYAQYRPSGATAAIVTSNLIQTLQAAFSTDRYKFAREDGYGTPEHQALVDGSQLAVGDYLVGAETYFIAALDPLVPILAVQCNAVLDVRRPAFSRSLGRVRGNDGDMVATETVLLSAWPASCIQGTKGEKSDTGIPGDTRMPWWAIILPPTPAPIETDDILTDANGHRFQVSSAELTSKGWRITAQLAQA